MKIAVPTNGGGIDDVVAPVFGRAPAFLIVEVDENGTIVSSKVLQNPAASSVGGIGPLAVQALINEGVDAVIVPQVGPNALGALQAAGIRVYQAAPGTPAREAIKSTTGNSSGQTGTFSGPTQEIGVGMMGATPAPVYGTYPVYRAYGYGSGWGRGRGRGFGHGRNNGRRWGARLEYCPRTNQPRRKAHWRDWW
ncbi:NifB/NifX family molybdenum-iron cluster-binding protein [Thermococcus thioreducens]|uniref:Dinitrogenase iron-molybdenum cofactor n=1 Tax=Thermococcus thioreducens TaxID=277988 RepID=A0A0Q2XLZ8_9EURY|nr:NifB/NifX family molybdenum-iron cluster-binding protein [Thermococcus thioreducens]ASJ12757.1 dinitrogenase iron-molybdenum cofactor [Thermococcus thioreducens]KQH82228.1 dinitrogenase iron-molybdenum cofactor [Thermococcus thioreducens]SEV85678.1 Predicted Fe-Mo cluster-binding protein, NifX family [Thermococcus thioreducens]